MSVPNEGLGSASQMIHVSGRGDAELLEVYQDGLRKVKLLCDGTDGMVINIHTDGVSAHALWSGDCGGNTCKCARTRRPIPARPIPVVKDATSAPWSDTGELATAFGRNCSVPCGSDDICGSSSDGETCEGTSTKSGEGFPTRLGKRLAGGGGSLPHKWKVSITSPTEVMPAEIIEGQLYLGNKMHARSKSILSNIGVTHVINVSRDDESTPKDVGIKYLHLKASDDMTSDLRKVFELAYEFMEAAWGEAITNKVLVHCSGGISRSSAVVISYLIRKQHQTLAASLAHVRSKHPAAQPNAGFLLQLGELERKHGVGEGIAQGFGDMLVTEYSPGSTPKKSRVCGEMFAPAYSPARKPAVMEAGGVKRTRNRAWSITYVDNPVVL